MGRGELDVRHSFFFLKSSKLCEPLQDRRNHDYFTAKEIPGSVSRAGSRIGELGQDRPGNQKRRRTKDARRLATLDERSREDDHPHGSGREDQGRYFWRHPGLQERHHVVFDRGGGEPRYRRKSVCQSPAPDDSRVFDRSRGSQSDGAALGKQRLSLAMLLKTARASHKRGWAARAISS